MSLWRQQRRAVRPATVIVLAAVVGSVLLTLLATGLTHRNDNDGGQTEQSSGAGPASTSTQVATSSEGSRAGSEMVLPTGTDQVDGYPVSFPHIDLGAAAALVEFNRAQIGFDYDQAAAIARVYAAPDDVDAVEARASDAVANRRQQLGVPAAGEPAAPAAFALTPFAFTLDELDTDYYAVTVLNLATTTNTNGEIRNIYYSGTQLVRWVSTGDGANDEAGDWKVVEPSAEDGEQVASLPQLPAVGPTDPQFAKSGWIAIKTPTSSTGTETGSDK